MRTDIGAVLVAAGYGSFRADDSPDGNKIPKVLEPVGGLPALCHLARGIALAELQCIVVVNPLFELQIMSALRRDDCQFGHVVQPDRFGSGDAAYRGARHLHGVNAFVMVYADMPLWQADTIGALAEDHVQSEMPITMVTVSLDLPDASPELERYGRICYNKLTGVIERVVEPAEWQGARSELPRIANPSLMAFQKEWFMKHVFQTPPFPKHDGHEPEYRIPPLVELAARDGLGVDELPLMDHYQALGFNTPAELELVRQAHMARAYRALERRHIAAV